jgi:hypothetical protein
MAISKGGVQTQNDRPVAAERSPRSHVSSDVFDSSASRPAGQLVVSCAACKFGNFKSKKPRGYCRARPMLRKLAGGVVLSTAQSRLVAPGRHWASVIRTEICNRFQPRGGAL